MEPNRQRAEREERLRARKWDNRWKTLIVCIAAAAVILIGIFVFADLKGLSVQEKTGKENASGNGFPYVVENTSESQNWLKTTGDQLVLLNGSLLEFINPSNGKMLKSEVHFFSNPVFDVNGKYVLTFDQGRTKFRLDTASSVLYETELEQKIITGAVAENGTFALATVPERGDSDLSVYSKSFKELFTWNSMDGSILEMDISPDGNYIAVATADTQNAVLKTTIHVFQIKKGEEIASFEVEGATAPVIQYVSSNDFFVITADSCFYVSNHKEKTDLLPAGEQTILNYAFQASGSVSLLYTKFEHSDQTMLAAYSKSARPQFTIELSEPVKSIYTSRSGVAVLFSDRVENYNRKGVLSGSTAVTPYAQSVVQFGSRLYLLSVDAVESVAVTPAEKEKAS